MDIPLEKEGAKLIEMIGLYSLSKEKELMGQIFMSLENCQGNPSTLQLYKLK